MTDSPITSFRAPHSFLSNFAASPITQHGLAFSTVEHAFQAAKTAIPAERERIQQTPSPVWAHRLGRRVTLRPDWQQVKVGILLELLRRKFADAVLAQKLLGTGDAELVEGSLRHDQEYGVCFCPRCGGQGQNLMGLLLMQVRDELRVLTTAEVIA